MIYAKKSLGQNFLTDQHYLDKIARDCIANHTNYIVEIGCGTGNLTKKLLEITNAQIHGIELDSRMTGYLDKLRLSHNNFTYELQDATRVDYTKYKDATVIGNLPYNIGSKIILDCIRAKVNRMVFLLQAEVVDRIAANIGSSDYTSLSVIVQSFYSVKAKYSIGPNSFNPRPKVRSRVIICDLLKNTSVDFDALSQLLRIAFKSPRKTLRNNIGNYISIDGLDHSIRPGQVSPSIYIELLKKKSQSLI